MGILKKPKRYCRITKKKLIDTYWRLEVEEKEFIEVVNNIAENNKNLLLKNNDYTSVVKMMLGIKRLCLLDKVLGRYEKV